MLTWKLEPMPDSRDQIVIRGADGLALGAVYVDWFRDATKTLGGLIYQSLLDGHSVDVEIGAVKIDGNECV